MSESVHVSVLLEEVVDFLRAKDGGAFLDCTLGGGGHTQAMLEANKLNLVTAIDRDMHAIKRAEKKFEGNERVRLVHASFAELTNAMQGEVFDGVLADLGMSTDQLKGERGFSFDSNSALDMRMDTSQGLTAADLVNDSEPRELFRIFKRGGVKEEAKRLVSEIINNRPIESTKALAAIARAVWPAGKKTTKDPATTVFQALRIEVNREFEQLEALLNAAPSLVKPGGRLAIISFHSLEDQAVAKVMRKWQAGDTAPAWWPKERGEQPLGRLLTKKAVLPSDEETERNPASRSAMLRVFEFQNGDQS